MNMQTEPCCADTDEDRCYACNVPFLRGHSREQLQQVIEMEQETIRESINQILAASEYLRRLPS